MASREPTADNACHIQAEMFAETATLGGLGIQLCYYRGIGEFEAGSASQLRDLLSAVAVYAAGRPRLAWVCGLVGGLLPLLVVMLNAWQQRNDDQRHEQESTCGLLICTQIATHWHCD